MKLAFVFPGQGSQAVGMLDTLADRPEVQALMHAADRALGEPLAQLIASGPIETLAQTLHTQPAMLLAGMACYQAWRAAGGAEAEILAGHSLGEYTALTAAGAWGFEQAIQVVRVRARAMQEAVPIGSGGMAAILGLDDDAVRALCHEVSLELAQTVRQTASVPEIVEPVNWNAPSQVVIAGSTRAVALACDWAKTRGAKRALMLPVSAPFHSSLLQTAVEPLAQALRASGLHLPARPVIHNVDVAVARSPADLMDALVRQAYSPVRWVELVRHLVAYGVTHVIEFGPGKVLAGLIRRIAPELNVTAVFDANSLHTTLTEWS